MFQKFIIVGNLGADPELRYTASGKAYARFSVAVDRRWTDAEGHQQEETTWFRVTVWAKQAEACNQYLHKGSKVLVEGERLHAQPYMTKDNQPAASLEMTAFTVRFLDSARSANGNGNGAAQPVAEAEEEMPF